MGRNVIQIFRVDRRHGKTRNLFAVKRKRSSRFNPVLHGKKFRAAHRLNSILHDLLALIGRLRGGAKRGYQK